MKQIGEYWDYILYQSEVGGLIEAWKTKERKLIVSVRPDGTGSHEHISAASSPDVERIVTTATYVVEAIVQIDRKLKKAPRRKKSRDRQQQLPLE